MTPSRLSFQSALRFRHALFAPLLALCLPLACIHSAPRTSILDPRNSYYIEDIPVPVGFAWDRARSEHKSEAGYRSVNHVYVGNADPLAVKNFYIQYMPRSNWELIDQTLQAGRDVLNYRKGQEKCKIIVEPSGSKVFGGRTQVRAVVRYANLMDTAGQS